MTNTLPVRSPTVWSVAHVHVLLFLLFFSSAQNDTVAARNKQSEFISVDYTFEDSREYRSVFVFVIVFVFVFVPVPPTGTVQ